MTTPKAETVLHLARDVDAFTGGYIEAMFWSSAVEPYGECPQCGRTAPLNRWDEGGNHVCDSCSDREPNYEPPADANYNWTHLATYALQRVIDDCAKFQADNREALLNCGLSQSHCGHDFWLTRNRHGSGFWDEDGDETVLKVLTDAAHAYGECSLYVGDNGKLYVQ